MGFQEYLEKYNIADYQKPSVAVDIICFDSTKSKVHLIRRLAHPFVNKLSLLGGFYVPSDTTIEHAALRELEEETNIVITEERLQLNGIHSKQNRDPRGWIMSISYSCILNKDKEELVKSGSDASETQWVDFTDLSNMELSFDHNEIIENAIQINGMRR